MGSFKKWVWNAEDQSVRGSFINLLMTGIYMFLLIPAGLLWDRIATNIEQMVTFLLGFYFISFGTWATKKSIEFMKFTQAEGIVNQTLNKLGITIGSAAQDNDKAKEKEAAK